MLDIYTLPEVRLDAVGSVLGVAIETVLSCDDIPVGISQRLTGMLALARADVIRLSDELDPTVATITKRPHPDPASRLATAGNR